MCDVKLNPEQTAWSQRYQAALSKHLARDCGTNLKPAFDLGCKAVLLKLEILDIIRVHEQALLVLILKKKQSAAKKRHITEMARIFFIETIVPIEKTHRAALKDDARIEHLTRVLQRRTVESTASIRNLKRSVVHRQAAEAALKKSRKRLSRLLQKSKIRQKRLQIKARDHIAQHEHTRKRTSRKLKSEIVQTLLGLNFSIAALKLSNHADLEKGIAETQLVVKQSTKVIQHLACKFGFCYET